MIEVAKVDCADTVCVISNIPDTVGNIFPDDSLVTCWHFASITNFADGVCKISHST